MDHGQRWIDRLLAHRLAVYAAIVGSALALRLTWVIAIDRAGFPWNDTLHYHIAASSVADGRGFAPLDGGPTARWPPGYTTVLAGLYKVFGVHPLAGEVFNALVGAATVLLLMVLVERAIGQREAVVAGVMLAVLPGPILWTDLLLSETLYTALFVTFVLVLVMARPSWPWMLALGFVMGVGVLVRGEALTWGLLPIVAFWSEVTRLELAKRVAVVAATCVIVMIPWTVRNAIVMDAFIPVATNASQTLWSGHNPYATGGQTYAPDGYFGRFSSDPRVQELEVSAAMRREALEFMVSNPLREAELVPLKLLHLNRGDSYALDWVNQVPDGYAPPLSRVWVERIGVVADGAYYALLTLTILAAFVLGRGFWGTRLGRCMIASFATALFLYGFLYYGNYRYRLPYEPLMVIASATLLTRIWRTRPLNSFA